MVLDEAEISEHLQKYYVDEDEQNILMLYEKILNVSWSKSNPS